LTNSTHIAQLVARIQKQDVVAMKSVYEYFAQEMLTSSYRITNDRQASEDILQEAFLTSFQKISSLAEPSKYKAWLKQIVINASLKWLKQHTNFEDLSVVVQRVEEEDSEWYKDIPFDKIRAAIQALPEGSRQVLSLYLLEGYKHREIASALGIALSTSKSQYAYGLKKLQTSLLKYRHRYE